MTVAQLCIVRAINNKKDLTRLCQVGEIALHNTGATGVAPACDITT